VCRIRLHCEALVLDVELARRLVELDSRGSPFGPSARIGAGRERRYIRLEAPASGAARLRMRVRMCAPGRLQVDSSASII